LADVLIMLCVPPFLCIFDDRGTCDDTQVGFTIERRHADFFEREDSRREASCSRFMIHDTASAQEKVDS